MSKGLYTRLAITNMKNNRQFYLPYLLTGILTVAMYYIMCALNGNEGLDSMPGAENVKMILGLGTIVIGIFSAIFLFYTNSFIIKRRKKELGVYNILGMEKKHLFKVLSLEAVFTAVIAIAGGLVTGIVFNKLMCMLLYKLIGYETGIDFYVSSAGVKNTILLFLIIYLLTLLYNMMQIKLANPIELLHGGNVGEREPKSKLLLAVLGVLCIGVGYYIAITTSNPMAAILLFFVAVLLVIAGTYCLFTAGSIVLLKLLRKNKNYYYKTRHFSSVSFLMYRMKQNAVGLANICILSTAVLVMVSATMSLYFGTQDELNERYPSDINISIDFENVDADFSGVPELAKQTAADCGRTVQSIDECISLTVAAGWQDEKVVFDRIFYTGTNMDGAALLWVADRDTCEKKFGEKMPELAENEIVLCETAETGRSELSVGGEVFRVKETRELLTNEDNLAESMVGKVIYVIVRDKAVMDKIYQMQRAAYEQNFSSYDYELQMNVDGTDEEKLAYDEAVKESLASWREAQPEEAGILGAYCESRLANEASFEALNGGFLFLGLFLGGMFLMITVLIIFYKQISEGYDDRERFVIMKKVGMSDGEVKATIRSQVRTVFFLPLVTAAIHVAAAFPMLRRLLLMFNLTNVGLFAICMVVSILIFAVIYFFVFLMTSRTYYRIVGEWV